MEEQEFSEEKKSEKQEKNTSEKLGFWENVLEWVRIIIWSLVIVVPIRVFLFQPFFVEGNSMEPNFRNGQFVIVKEWGYKKTEIDLGKKKLFTVEGKEKLERGQVVVFRYPKNPKVFYIKRVIGLPGDKIEIKDSQVKIYNSKNPKGIILDESSYIPSSFSTDCLGSHCSFDLKEGEYVVMGDNRSHSSDSREWGVVPREMLVGVVKIRTWPIETFQFF